MAILYEMTSESQNGRLLWDETKHTLVSQIQRCACTQINLYHRLLWWEIDWIVVQRTVM